MEPSKDISLLSNIALSFGTTEPALRLLLSILICYPVSAIHRHFLARKSAALQNMYFIVIGVCIGMYNYGKDVYHNILCTVVQYLIFVVFGANRLSLLVSFLFQCSYLIIGYIYTESELYDIKWTMPHCVLTLRLIGLSFDFFDGGKDFDKLSSDQKESALKTTPSLLTVGGHAFFPPTYLVGPLVSMKRYQNFIDGTLYTKEKEDLSLDSEKESCTKFSSRCVEVGLKRAAFGVVYMVSYIIGSLVFSESFILSEEFKSYSFPARILFIGLFGKVCLCKYISCWLLAEGACIMIGISYNGIDSSKLKKQPKYDVTSNVNLYIYETSTNLQDMIVCFNTNTNAWAAQYIYKRLKFFNSKLISQGLTLIFLAIWHGLHSGYYASFAFEMLSVNTERQFLRATQGSWWNSFWRMSWICGIKFVLLRLYSICVLSYGITPFLLLTSAKYLPVISNVYFYGHILYLSITVIIMARKHFSKQKIDKSHSS